MNFKAVMDAEPVIQLHLAAAIIALILGTLMFIRPKGTPSHRMIGRAFLIMMIAAAISSYFIRIINQGALSWIHIFIPITFLASFQAVYYIRKKDIKRHKRAVQGMFFGALIIPGLFTFLPGRLMHTLFFGG